MGVSDLDISITRPEEGKAVVSLDGEVDVTSAPRVRVVVGQIIEQGVCDIVVDMRRVAFLDSMGLGAFVEVMKQLRDRGGNLALGSPVGVVAELLTISGLDHVMPVVDLDDRAPTSDD